MMNESTNWLPALVALLIGAGIGVAIAMQLLKEKLASVGGATESTVDDLDEQANHLITLLRDLETQKERLDPTAYADEKAALEARAAEALRQRDHSSDTTAAPGTPAKPQSGGGSQLVGFLWGGGLVAFLALIYVLVSSSATPDPGGMGGAAGMGMGAPTGPMGQMGQAGEAGQAGMNNPQDGANPQGPMMDPEIKALAEKLHSDPSDVGTLVSLGHRFIVLRALDDARMVTEKALAIDSNHLEARAHSAFLMTFQKPDAGVAQLRSIAEQNSEFAEPWLLLGMAGAVVGDPVLARESFTKFVAVAPEGDEKDQVRTLLQTMGNSGTHPPANDPTSPATP